MTNKDIPPEDKWDMVKGDKYFEAQLSSEKERLQIALDYYMNEAPRPSTTFEPLTHYDENVIKSFKESYDESFVNLLKSYEDEIKKDWDRLYDFSEMVWTARSDYEYIFYDEDFYKDQFKVYLKELDREENQNELADLTAIKLFKLMHPDLKEKREKGAPTYRNQKADLKLLKEWGQAKPHMSREEFCADKNITVNELEKARRACHPDRLKN